MTLNSIPIPHVGKDPESNSLRVHTPRKKIWGFPNFGVPSWGPHFKGILLLGLHIGGSTFSYTPIWVCPDLSTFSPRCTVKTLPPLVEGF